MFPLCRKLSAKPSILLYQKIQKLVTNSHFWSHFVWSYGRHMTVIKSVTPSHCTSPRRNMYSLQKSVHLQKIHKFLLK